MMNLLESLFEKSLIDALGWALIHFIWQGTLVATLLAVALRILQAWSSNLRYAAACVAMLLMLVLPPATIALISLSATKQSTRGVLEVFTTRSDLHTLSGAYEPATPDKTELVTSPTNLFYFFRADSLLPLLPWMILVWLLGVGIFSLRLTCAWVYTQRLKLYMTRTMDGKWEEALHRLCEQLQLRRPIRLLESTIVGVPTVIGWLRPVVILPVSAVTGLSWQQLEALIAHELAHIRRHDYLINLLQAVIETLLFYHPAVWWVSRRIRQEREHCCDDLAVAVCGNALTYARALLEMEQLRAAGPQLAMAANGGLLMNRIQRLLGMQTQQTDRFPGLVAGLMLLLSMVSLGVVAQTVLPSSTRDKFELLDKNKTIQRDGNLKDEQLKRVKEQLEQVVKLKDEQLKSFKEQVKQDEKLRNEQLKRVKEQVKQDEKLKDEQLKRVEQIKEIEQKLVAEQIKQDEKLKGEQVKRVEQIKEIEKHEEDQQKLVAEQVKQDEKLKGEQVKRVEQIKEIEKHKEDQQKLVAEQIKQVKLKDEQLKHIAEQGKQEMQLKNEQPKRVKKLRRVKEQVKQDEQLKNEPVLKRKDGETADKTMDGPTLKLQPIRVKKLRRFKEQVKQDEQLKNEPVLKRKDGETADKTTDRPTLKLQPIRAKKLKRVKEQQ
jgi:beta-lactamase regulating signal transducer with metallopeptidase domain